MNEKFMRWFDKERMKPKGRQYENQDNDNNIIIIQENIKIAKMVVKLLLLLFIYIVNKKRIIIFGSRGMIFACHALIF